MTRIRRGRPLGAAWLLLPLALVTGCTEVTFSGPEAPDIDQVEFAPELGIDLGEMEERESGLWVRDLEVGEGEQTVESGDEVAIHYVGWLPDGRTFDSSRARNQPLRFVVGRRNVIAGMNEGVIGMRVGGERLLLVPPHLGYGPRGSGSIPPNSWTVFEIELVEIP